MEVIDRDEGNVVGLMLVGRSALKHLSYLPTYMHLIIPAGDFSLATAIGTFQQPAVRCYHAWHRYHSNIKHSPIAQ